MIDYSKYNLSEMQAIVTVLDDLTDEMGVQKGYENDFYIALSEYMRASTRATALINQQARDREAAEAEKVNRIKEACVAGAPPAEAPAPANCILNNCGSQLLNCPIADPPAEPDMFGWVGDALDGLEVKLSD